MPCVLILIWFTVQVLASKLKQMKGKSIRATCLKMGKTLKKANMPPILEACVLFVKMQVPHI